MQQHTICFLIRNYNNIGGTERVTSIIANGLAQKGQNVSIICLEKGTSPYFQTNNRIKIYEFNTSSQKSGKGMGVRVQNLINDIKVAKKLSKLIRVIKPDFIIAVDIVLYRCIHFIKIPSKLHKIGWEHFCFEARQRKLVKLSRIWASKHADKIIVLSDADLESYQKNYPYATNLMRIYNPIAYNSTYNYQPNSKIVIAAGRYAPQKGFDLLIESWSRIADKIPDWELRIFGDGELRNELQAQIDHYNLSNVKLCGFTKELDRELEKASIFALSSRFEGWGLVLIEAQAKGLPCISFNCKCGPSEIIDDGVNGLLVSPENTEEFAEKLLLLMQNEELRRSFSANAQKDLYRFDSEKVVGEWIALFDSLSKE